MPDRPRTQGARGAAGRIWTAIERIRYPLKVVASLLGYGITALVLWWSLTNRGIGNDVHVWDRVGDEVRMGISPYYPAAVDVQNFFYAPPWALLFGALSWVPIELLALLLFAVSLASLRYIARSWLGVGFFGLCFVTGGELATGNINLVIAAAIAAAIRGDSRPAVLAALAKLSPAVVINEWRRPLVFAFLLLLVTLPVAGWWLGWIDQLQHAATLGLGFPIPYWLRLAVAGAIVLLGRNVLWRSLAAAVAIPGFYIYSIVLLYPLVAELPRLLRQPSGTADGASLSSASRPLAA